MILDPVQIVRVVIRIMKFIRSLFIAIILLVQFSVPAMASDRYNWMDSSMNALKGLFGCIEVPVFAGMYQAKHSLELDNSENWMSTGVRVQDGKLLQIEWLTKGVLPRPAKYRVLYRIDPRFSVPQVFIQKYNFTTKKYVSDFHQFKGGQLLRYQDTAEMTFEQRIADYNDYFNFNGRAKIPVKKNDVINITMDTTGKFFSSDSEMDRELFGAGIREELLSIYTTTSVPDNRILYSNSLLFCNSTIDVSHPSYTEYCQTFFEKFWDLNVSWSTYIGKMDATAVTATKWQNMLICPDAVNGMDNNPSCQYNLGRGMIFSVGGTEIKNETQKFIHSPFTGKDFFYHKSDTTGDLEFKSPWSIDGMYNTDDQLMSEWASIPAVTDYDTFYTHMTKLKSSLYMNFLYMGRYLMEIEVGNSSEVVSPDDLRALQVEYYISETAIPNSGTSGTSIEQDFRGNANANGFLWLRVINPNQNITGTIQVKTANYTGTTWFSDIVYNHIVKPLRDKFNELSEVIYRKLISNAALQNIARLMLVIYIIIYGLMFLAGATQITVTDIVMRVLKIGVVLALFSETSWTFFSRNLFNVFIEGTEYLMTTVIGVTSSAGNIFGFIDPVIEKYTNGNMWGLLFIQLLQIHNGLTFFAIMTIYSILIFFRAVLQVIVGYCLAFLGLAVMISIAPFFIILILFERTKSMFDNWISTMFSQMIQPTILLIFFLLIDQIMGEVVTRTIVRACWDILIPIKIGLDLNHMSIPISFSFTLPFLPGIPFFVPEVRGIGSMTDFFYAPGTFAMLATSSFLFFALCKLADGLVDYVTLVVQYLTNVLAARQDGKLQSGMNPIKDITSDMGKLASPITGAAKGVGKFAKEKLIDQKISRRATKSDGGDIDYGSANRSKSEEQTKVNKTDSGAKKSDTRKDDDSGTKNKFSKFGGKKSTSAGKDDSSKLRADGDKSKDPKGGTKKDTSDKILSAKKKPAIGAHRKGATENVSTAQREASKGSDATAKATIGGTTIGSSSTTDKTDMTGSESSDVQRQDFTQTQHTSESGRDTTTGGDFGTSTGHGSTSDDGTTTGSDNQTTGMGSHSSVDSHERSGVDSGSGKVDSHEKLEPSDKGQDTHLDESETNKESSESNKSGTERRLSKKLTGDHD